MNQARQLPMFGDGRIDAAVLVSIAKPSASLSKAQQAFNRMVAKIGVQRELLRQWQEFLDTSYARRVATEVAPLQGELRDGRRAMAQLLDELLSFPPAGERNARSQRAQLARLLLAVVDASLIEGPDALLEALHDKYSDTTREALRQAELEMTEALLGDMLGPAVVEAHGASSAEDLLAHAQKKLLGAVQRQASEREARRHKRGKASPAQRAEERNQEAARQASQSVRDIYRKLASALHPDRETNPQERDRKTRLMQRANQCYEANDLLGLLSLQIETLQIDPEHIADLPDERLARYNHVLREQLAQLEAEVEACVAPMRALCGLAPWDASITPQRVEAELERQIAHLRQAKAQLQSDLENFRDPKLRRVRLKALLSEMRADPATAADNDFSTLLAALAHSAPTPSRSRRRR